MNKKNENNKVEQLSTSERFTIKHNKSTKYTRYGIGIILVIVLASFIAWPILTSSTSNNKTMYLGSYRGENIEYNGGNLDLYGRNLNMLTTYYNNFQNTNTPAIQRMLFQKAFFLTVKQYGNFYYLQDRGNHVSQEEMHTVLYQQLAKDGKISHTAWTNIQNNPNRLKSEEIVAHFHTAQSLWDDIYRPMDIINATQLHSMLPTLGDMRTVSYLYFKMSEYPEAKVQDFYSQNSKLFQKASLQRLIATNNTDAQSILNSLKEGEQIQELAKNDPYESRNQNSQRGQQYYYQVLHELYGLNPIQSYSQVTQWVDQIFALEKSQYIGPIKLHDQFYFYQVAAPKKVAAKSETKEPKEKSSHLTLMQVVRDYITTNKRNMVEDYFRQKLQEFKSHIAIATVANSQKDQESLLNIIQQEKNESLVAYGSSADYFGFNYNKNGNVNWYNPMDTIFTEEHLAPAIVRSAEFFQQVFALQQGEMTDVLLLQGTEKAIDAEEYLIFFRLEDQKPSDTKESSDKLQRKQEVYQYYATSLLESATQVSYLSPKNLKQNLHTTFQKWQD